MSRVIKRLYGVADTVEFSLYNADGIKQYSSALTTGDVKVSIDGGAPINIDPTFTNGVYYLSLTNVQMQCKKIHVNIEDQDTTAVYMSDDFTIETYGHASAQHVSIDQTGDSYIAITAVDSKVDIIDGNLDSVLVDTGTDIPASITALSNALSVVDGNIDLVLEDTGTTLPSSISAVESKVDIIDTIVDSIIEDTSTTIPIQITGVSNNVNSILVDTGTTIPAQIVSLDANVSSIDTIVGEILVDTSTSIPSSISSINSKVDIIDTNVDAILIDTGTTLQSGIDSIDSVVSSMPATLTVIDSKVNTIVNKLPTGNISDFAITTEVEPGHTVGDALSLNSAMVDGKMVTDTNLGTIQLYKRDNVTPISNVTVTETTRERA